MEPESYLTVKDVAQLLKVSERSVARWTAQDPTLPVLKLGNVVRFPQARLLKWLREREQGRATPRRIGRQMRSAATTGS